MSVHKVSSLMLHILILGALFSLNGVCGSENGNNVKYEFGARLPRKDLVTQANQKKVVYNILPPPPNFRVVQKPATEKLEQKVYDTLQEVTKINKPAKVREQVLQPRRIVRPVVYLRKSDLEKIDLPKVDYPKVELPKVKYPKVDIPKEILPSNIEAPKRKLRVEEPKIEKPKLEPSEREIFKPENQEAIKEQIRKIVGEPEEAPIKEAPIPKPRKLKKYVLRQIPKVESKETKEPLVQPATPNVKILQKPVAFSFTPKDPKPSKNEDNTVAGTEVHENEEDEEEGKGGHGGGGGGGGGRGGRGGKEHTEPREESASFKHGGGSEQHSGHYSEKGDKGEKKFKGHEDYEKEEKGHHDKEGHQKEYEEDRGSKKNHHYDDDHHSEHEKAEKGRKDAEYDEHGKYSKGWSTKGEHKIHRLDDYEKKKVFFDESHDEGDEEDEGAYYEEKEYESGGGKKGHHRDSGKHTDHYFKEGEHKKGGHDHDHRGHEKGDKHSKYYRNHEEHGRKGGGKESKKWGQQHQEAYHHEHPVHQHREPTRHIIWEGHERSDHDVADTEYVPATVQKSSKKKRKTKRQHPRNEGVSERKHWSEGVDSSHAKRDANIQRPDNNGYYFVTYH